MASIALGLPVEHELVLEGLAAPTAMHEEVFELGQAREMHLQLRVAPAGRLAHLAAAEAVVGASHVVLGAVRIDHRDDEAQEAPRLRRQLIERAPQDLMRKRIGERDVLERHLDVADCPARMLHGAQHSLMLVQERDRIDEGEVLLVIAPHARAVIEEGETVRVRVHDRQRLDEALRILVQREDPVTLGSRMQARQRPPRTLRGVDCGGLRAPLIDCLYGDRKSVV